MNEVWVDARYQQSELLVEPWTRVTGCDFSILPDGEGSTPLEHCSLVKSGYGFLHSRNRGQLLFNEQAVFCSNRPDSSHKCLPTKLSQTENQITCKYSRTKHHQIQVTHLTLLQFGNSYASQAVLGTTNTH